MIDTPSISYQNDPREIEKSALHLNSFRDSSSPVKNINMQRVNDHMNVPSTTLENHPLLDKIKEEKSNLTSRQTNKSFKRNLGDLPSLETQEFFNI
jgi:hypothetical protein